MMVHASVDDGISDVSVYDWANIGHRTTDYLPLLVHRPFSLHSPIRRPPPEGPTPAGVDVCGFRTREPMAMAPEDQALSPCVPAPQASKEAKCQVQEEHERQERKLANDAGTPAPHRFLHF